MTTIQHKCWHRVQGCECDSYNATQYNTTQYNTRPKRQSTTQHIRARVLYISKSFFSLLSFILSFIHFNRNTVALRGDVIYTTIIIYNTLTLNLSSSSPLGGFAVWISFFFLWLELLFHKSIVTQISPHVHVKSAKSVKRMSCFPANYS